MIQHSCRASMRLFKDVGCLQSTSYFAPMGRSAILGTRHMACPFPRGLVGFFNAPVDIKRPKKEAEYFLGGKGRP